MQNLRRRRSWVAKTIYFLFFWLLPATAALTAQWSCLPDLPECKAIYVVHISWHASIVLIKNDLVNRRAIPELTDFPHVQWIEFSWGDRDYFPHPQSGALTAIKAAFWSSGSVLHLVGFAGDLKKFYPGAEIVSLHLSLDSYDRLIEFISQTFRRPQSGQPAPGSAGLFPYSRFYPATRQFSLLRTCNTWVAEALASAGLPLSPKLVITAGNLANQIAELSAAN